MVLIIFLFFLWKSIDDILAEMMLDFQRKKRFRQILYSPLVAGIAVVIALYAIYSTFSVYRKYVQSKSELSQSEAGMLALDKQNTDLDSQLRALQTPQGIEDEIRTKYGMAKTGEALAVISDDEPVPQTGSTTETWWRKFLDFMGLWYNDFIWKK